MTSPDIKAIIDKMRVEREPIWKVERMGDRLFKACGHASAVPIFQCIRRHDAAMAGMELVLTEPKPAPSPPVPWGLRERLRHVATAVRDALRERGK